MRIKISVTTQDIQEYVTYALEKYEEYGLIAIPETTARDEFISECVETVAQYYELYESDEWYTPNYSDIVYDLAKLYSYIKDD